MPQNGMDSVVSDDGTTTTYYDNYDSLSPEAKQFIDSITNGHAHSKAVVDEFQRKSDMYSSWALPLTVLLFVGTWYLLKFFSKNPFHLKLDDDEPVEPVDSVDASSSPGNYVSGEVCLTYEGNGLNFSEEDIRTIFSKRFSYFNVLSPSEQQRFLLRHKKFMRDKTFKIHDDSGFREMSVLICASAIQLSFGLEEYMLPDYSFINIYPQEFIRISDGIHFLEGNVSGNSIKISWKHFLEGYQLPDNGENVGLHEMAHAYYSQNFLFREDEDTCFINGFHQFNDCGQRAYESEQTRPDRFYSDYALRNFQEFWAESVERFFEKPQQMKMYYPEVYECLCALLNQVPR